MDKFLFCVSLITFIFHGKLINNFKCARNFFHSDLFQCFSVSLAFEGKHLKIQEFESESCSSWEFTYSIFISKQKLVIRECFHNFMFEMKDSIKTKYECERERRWGGELNVLVWEINSFGFGNETHEDQGKCLRVEIFYMEWHLKWKSFINRRYKM